MGGGHRPHPFFWIFLLALVLGALAALTAGSRSPSWSLESNTVYRVEVGTVVGGLIYLLAIGGWLAWQGRTFKRVGIPGGPEVEAPSDALNATATQFGDFKKQAEERFSALETATKDLNERVEKLEAG